MNKKCARRWVTLHEGWRTWGHLEAKTQTPTSAPSWLTLIQSINKRSLGLNCCFPTSLHSQISPLLQRTPKAHHQGLPHPLRATTKMKAFYVLSLLALAAFGLAQPNELPAPDSPERTQDCCHADRNGVSIPEPNYIPHTKHWDSVARMVLRERLTVDIDVSAHLFQ